MQDPAPAPLPDSFRDLLDSDRVSRRTRSVLLGRLPTPEPPPVLDPAQTVALRAVVARVVPQDDSAIDLAPRVMAVLADGAGDGWRVAAQPPDLEAYRAALDTLDRAARAAGASGFGQLTGEAQDVLLRRVAAGEGPSGALSPEQMQVWFEDVRSDATRAFVAHPATLARMGYSGVGYGGDGERLQGFQQTGLDEREAWEPRPAMEPRP